MNSGYTFTELRVSGENVADASIQFDKGLNVITGPSDTGKTYIYECIDYMLGASRPPKAVKQSRNYNKIYLEIEAVNSIIYTLEGDLKGGGIKLYKGKIDEITFDNEYEVLNRKHNPNSDETISAFFQKLNNIYGSEVRKNARGTKRQLSYRDIARYILVDEERIITKQSLIESSYVNRTVDKSTLKFIISGEDDSDIIALVNKDAISNKKGRLEYINETIEELTKDIENTTLAQIELEINSIDQRVSDLKLTYSNISGEMSLIRGERTVIINGIKQKETNKKELEELYFRSSYLKNQYDIDIKRLESTIEAGVLLVNSEHEPSQCPVCKRGMPEECDEKELQQIIVSCTAEINKIKNLRLELENSVQYILEEITSISDVLSNLYEDLKLFDDNVDDNLGKKLAEVLSLLEELNERKNKLLGLKVVKNNINKLISQKEKLDHIIKESRTKGDFESISTASLSDLSKQIESVLKGCNYPNLTAVSFSEDHSDFVISGEDRSLFGKGYRAIIYAAFIIAIQKQINGELYSIGVPVLDSPLVTYKKSDVEKDDVIPIDLAMDFYRYLASEKEVIQSVIIENVDPPEELNNSINHIKFSGSNDIGRYGFFPL